MKPCRSALAPALTALALVACPGIPVLDDDAGALDASSGDTAAPDHAVQDSGTAGDLNAPADVGSGFDSAPADTSTSVDASSQRDAISPWDAADVGARPEDPGSFTFGESTHSLDVPGGTSGRQVGITLFIPDGAQTAPAVVLLPGFQLASTLYTSYGEHLASHGFLTVLLDLPTALLGGPTHAELATYTGLVLDWLTTQNAGGGALDGALDASRIALAGHSMGGKIALLRATTDARVRAVFGVDPVDSAGGPLSSPGPDYPSVTPERMDQIAVPIVLLGETTNATCTGFMCQPCAPAADNFDAYYTHATSPALEITVLGANHMSFLDNPACGLTCSACSAGSDDPEVTRRLTRRYLTAFVDLILRGDSAARTWLDGAGMLADQNAGLVTHQLKNGF
ncbi:MAG: alpha/beta fold hydrolase [Pseudomonadota bacterium]